jgi:isocitrate dehydrogenase
VAHRRPEKVIEFLEREMGKRIRPDSGIGIKPISETGTKRLVRMAIQYAIDNHRKTVTLVHKGNIMKFTGGGVPRLGVRGCEGRVPGQGRDRRRGHGGASRDGKVLVNDRIADSVFQQVLTRTADYDVFATPNLNGDYLSDPARAGRAASGWRQGRQHTATRSASFEATHGTAPKYVPGKDVINPSS